MKNFFEDTIRVTSVKSGQFNRGIQKKSLDGIYHRDSEKKFNKKS